MPADSLTQGWRRDLNIAPKAEPHEQNSYVALAIVFTLPTLAAFGPYIPALGSFFAFRVAAMLLLLMTLLGKRGSAPVGIQRLTVGLVSCWALVAILSLLLLGPSAGSWSELLSLGSGLAALLAFALMPAPRQVLAVLLYGWLLAYLIVSIFAIVELRGGVPISSSASPQPSIDGWGLTVTFFNPNNYATFLLYSFLALISLWVFAKGGWVRALALSCALSVPLFMMFTNSRTGVWVLAVFISCGVLFYLKYRPVLRFAIAFATIAGAVFVLNNMGQTPFDELAHYLRSSGYSISVFGISVPVDSSTFVRWELSLAAGALWSTFPLLGAGSGYFETFMATSGWQTQTLGILSPHNGFMEVLSQYGILVFGILLAWLMRMVAVAVRSKRVGGRDLNGWGTTLLLGVVSLPVVLTMHSSTIEPSTTWLFFLFLLLVARSAEDGLQGIGSVNQNALMAK